jgi:hypothetical protein
MLNAQIPQYPKCPHAVITVSIFLSIQITHKLSSGMEVMDEELLFPSLGIPHILQEALEAKLSSPHIQFQST